jgi:hypothetical protein
MPSKFFLTSKTLWINALGLTGSLLQLLLQGLETGQVPDNLLPYAPALVFLINLGLRFTTQQPVRLQR